MERLHRYRHDGKRYVIDTETCFCFECDDISWDVLEHYPHTPANRIYHLLGGKHDPKELAEVVGELEWLRATKAILPAPKQEDEIKRFSVARGLRELTVVLPEPRPGSKDGAKQLLTQAGQLLLARSGEQTQLRLLCVGSREALGAASREVPDLFRLARLAGKQLTLSAGLRGEKGGFQGHTLTILENAADEAAFENAVAALSKADTGNVARLGKRLASGRVVLLPGSGDLQPAVAALEKAGIRHIELDLDGAFGHGGAVTCDALFSGIRDTARYYAERLRGGHYFRLEPLAGLFKRIYEGSPINRHDPAGLNALAVDSDGSIYPSPALVGNSSARLGSLADGTLDDAALRPYEDLGALTTPACLRCWARHLCGGGAAAVHLALGGGVRTPALAWCEQQRALLEASVAAFNLLSVEGVNFTRVYESLAPSGRPSFFTMVKAAMTVRLSMRPIAEADAELLTQWENWSESAYFLTHESSMFMATRYDREMDALHPRGFEQESMLTRPDGTPVGLMRIRPARLPGCAHVWLFLHDESLYASESVRRSFRFLLEQAGKTKVNRLLVPAGPKEDALADFLAATGFEEAGTQREALYLHGRYHDVRWFARGA